MKSYLLCTRCVSTVFIFCFVGFTTNPAWSLGSDIDENFNTKSLSLIPYSTHYLIEGIDQLENGQLPRYRPFTYINGVPRSRIARLNADGSVDESFKAPLIIQKYEFSNDVQFERNFKLGVQ